MTNINRKISKNYVTMFSIEINSFIPVSDNLMEINSAKLSYLFSVYVDIYEQIQ